MESQTGDSCRLGPGADMASIHIRDVQRWLAMGGQPDAEPGPEGMFLEIRFDEGGGLPVPDVEFANKVITALCPQGVVTIVFDSSGSLRSLDIS